MSRTYKIWLVDNKTQEPDFCVDADDIALNSDENENGSNGWFDFHKGETSVAAVPYDMLRYVKS